MVMTGVGFGLSGRDTPPCLNLCTDLRESFQPSLAPLKIAFLALDRVWVEALSQIGGRNPLPLLLLLLPFLPPLFDGLDSLKPSWNGLAGRAKALFHTTKERRIKISIHRFLVNPPFCT